jgi:hypothetical protein
MAESTEHRLISTAKRKVHPRKEKKGVRFGEDYVGK